MTRPSFTYGAVGVALLRAAAHGPAPVRELAQRAQVGYAAARYTASRLQAGGALVADGAARPQALAVVPEIAARVPGFFCDDAGGVLML